MARQHLYEVDLMRAFIMLGVLSVHTVTAYMGNLDETSSSYVAVAAIHTSMHFTRESFMFITGLVLFITYYYRDFNPFRFWGKRLLLVAVPFVVWAILDTLWAEHNKTHPDWSADGLTAKITHLLVFGDNFHLYYIVVSIQLYMVFPVLLYVIKKLERWHVHIFIASFAIQMSLMAFYEFTLPHLHKAGWPKWLAVLANNHGTFVLTYQFWFIAGGIVACHYRDILSFISRHAKTLRTSLIAAVVFMWGHYLFNRFILHQSAAAAESVDQPLMIPYALLVTAGIWYTGVRWARRRKETRYHLFNRFVRIASDASFGIYLLQIYPLHFVQLIVRAMDVPSWLYFGSIPVAILFVYLSAMVMSHLIGKIPYISYIVGRKVRSWKTEQRVTVTM